MSLIDVELRVLIEDLLNDDNEENRAFSPNTSLQQSNQKKKRSSLVKYPKRLSNNPKFMPCLRILRRDVRRKYSTMLANAFNSHDVDYVARFFQEFSFPNIEICHEFGGGSPCPRRRSQVFGIDKIVESFRMNFLLMPDSVFRFHDVKVCQQLKESGSRIISYATVKGTMLYEMKKQGESDSSHTHHQHGDDDATMANNEDSCKNDARADSPVSRTPLTMPMKKLNKPVEVSMDSVIVLDLDSDHRITCMTMRLN